MANSKISALTSATTVVGTEVLPIVQSSATVKVSVANLTPGLGTITAAKGGTGQTSYAVGDLLYADTTTTLAKLADVATGNALISGGVSTVPSWGKIGLTTHVSGVLPVANGGTNASSASITAFNNITGYSASGATGTTTTNLVFSTSPTLTTPSITGDATLTTGNVVVSNGKGIDFSATPGTGTSELLADYEEGTWSPAFVGTGTLTTVTYAGVYTKIGRIVNCTASIDISNWGTFTALSYISGLPFTSNASFPTPPILLKEIYALGYMGSGQVAANSTQIVDVSYYNNATILAVATSRRIYVISLSYSV
jgi:hypothetical protein